jgi:MFS family permease
VTLAAYKPLLARGDVRLLLFALLLNGLTTGLAPAMVLVVEEEHSLGSAGLVLAAFAICTGVSSPVRGRLVDRHGQPVVLVPLAALSSGALIAFALLAENGASVATLAVLAGFSGATFAPVIASARALWKEIARDEHELTAAYSLHSVANEVLFVMGPLAVGAIVAVASAAAAVAAAAAGQLAGILVFAAMPLSRAWRGEARTVGRLGALVSPGMRTLALGNIAFGGIFGILDVAAPALALEQGEPAVAGFALAALAVGSGIGGLFYGSRRWRAPLERRLLVAFAAMTVGLLPLALAGSSATLILFMAVAGLAVAPFVAIEFSLIDRVAPAGTVIEAFTWTVTSYMIGSAVGAGLAGYLAEHVSVTSAFLSAVAASAMAFAVTVARRATLAESVPAQ